MTGRATKILVCKYDGAVAWGKHYPSQQGGKDATNGSAPGYVHAEKDGR